MPGLSLPELGEGSESPSISSSSEPGTRHRLGGVSINAALEARGTAVGVKGVVKTTKHQFAAAFQSSAKQGLRE